MKKVIRYLIIAAFFFLIFFILPSIILSLVLFPPVKVEEGSFLHVVIEGELSEKARGGLLGIQFTKGAPTMLDILRGMEDASKDERIKGVFLELKDLGAGWAKMEEIAYAISKFREKGKPAYAFGDSLGIREYYLATSCDGVFMPPQGFLFLTGFSSSYLYLKKTLDMVGIEADIEHIGDYKSAGETYYREEMSEELKSVLDSILDQYFDDLIDTIARNRKLEREKVERFINEPPFTLPPYLEAGFIDGLKFLDEIEEELFEKDSAGEPKLVTLSDYLSVSRKGKGGLKKIAYIPAAGVISWEDGRGGIFQDILTEDGMREMLETAREDEEVEGVLVRVDSPGGSGIVSDAIWKEMALTAHEKPLVVSMSDIAASGGYYISLPALRIVANPGTLTGSIGVLGGKFVLSGLAEKVKVNIETLSRGEYSEIFSPFSRFSEAEREKLRVMLEDFYENFIHKVAEGRRLERDRVLELSRGRVWTGLQAWENGLVDETGGLSRAVEVIKELCGIPPGEEIALKIVSPKMTPLEMAKEIFRIAAWVFYREDNPSDRIMGILPSPSGKFYPRLEILKRSPFLQEATLKALISDPVWAIVPAIPYLSERGG